MRVCMILEGSYPYVHGGVSSWMHQYIQAMPEVDFVLWCIGAQAGNRGHYKYELPENVVEVHEVFLDDALEQKLKNGGRKLRFTQEERTELEKLFEGESLNWDVLFELFQDKKVNPVNMMMSPMFLNINYAAVRGKIHIPVIHRFLLQCKVNGTSAALSYNSRGPAGGHLSRHGNRLQRNTWKPWKMEV